MVRFAALVLLVAACSAPPAVPDAGASDAGGPCGAAKFEAAPLEGVYILSVDGVVGLPSKIAVLVEPQPELGCLSGTFTGPGGITGPVAVALNPKFGKHDFTFTPPTAGTYKVTLAIDGGGSFVETVEVFARAAASQVLARSCQSVIHSLGMIGCDEQLFTESGAPFATLDGGRWLGNADGLFAWQGGLLSRAEISDGGVIFSATTPSPFPESWSSTKDLLAVANPDAGAIFELDAGAIARIADVAGSAVVTVFINGVVSLHAATDPCGSASQCQWARLAAEPKTENRFSLAVDDLVSANAQSSARYGPGNLRFMLRCEQVVADGGFENRECGTPWTYGRYHFWNRREPVSRKPLVEMSHGVRADATAMYLEGAERISSTDDWVWQSSATETAIWK